MGLFKVKNTDSGFSFNILADNNEIIGTSQVYTTKQACVKGIASVQSNAVYAAVEDQTTEEYESESNPKFVIFTDKADEYRFRLLAGNGKIILSSESYKAKDSCLKAIESVQSNSFWSEIKEVE